MIEVPTVKLNNDIQMPILGLGTFQSPPGQVEQAVEWAIDAGYRHIDTAFIYNNEREVGRAVRGKINDGVIKREDIFIVSKLWVAFMTMEAAIKMCKESSDNLGLGYIDLFLVHAPTASEEPRTHKVGNYLEAWKGLEKCLELGYVKSIGVSNFNSEQITVIIEKANVRPVVNQVECNTNINQLPLIEFCKKHDIVVTAHTPLGSPNSSLRSTKSHFNDTRIIEIGKKYNKTPAQVMLRFLIQIQAYPLPKSVTQHRVEENINVFDFVLEESEMEYLKSLNTGQRRVLWESFRGHKDWPFKIPF